MIGIALLFETDVGTMPVLHLMMLGRYRANYNMQDTVLAQLLYTLNTAHTYVDCVPRWYDAADNLLMQGRRRTKDLERDDDHALVVTLLNIIYTNVEE